MPDIVTPPMPQEMAPLPGSEEFLWSGKPKQGLMFRTSDWLVVPASLIVVGTSLKPYWDALSKAMQPLGMIGVAVFSLLGLYLLIGRFFIDAYVRRDMVYGLTSHRALIIGGFFGRKVLSIDLKTLSQVSLAVRSDGLGTIVFGPNGGLDNLLAGGFWIGGVWIDLTGWFRQRPQNSTSVTDAWDRDPPPPPKPAQFEAIPDAELVMATIQQAQATLATPPAVPNPNQPGVTPAWSP